MLYVEFNLWIHPLEVFEGRIHRQKYGIGSATTALGMKAFSWFASKELTESM